MKNKAVHNVKRNCYALRLIQNSQFKKGKKGYKQF